MDCTCHCHKNDVDHIGPPCCVFGASKEHPYELSTPDISKDEKIYPFYAYNNIVTWLYEKDGAFNSKTEWRKEFIALLKHELKI